MSSDLDKYFELQDRIEKLNDEVDLREQIKLLKSEVVKLNKQVVTARKNASKHKRANDTLRKKYGLKVPSRCEKARKLLIEREASDVKCTLKSIADECFLAYSTVKSLARDIRCNDNE